jgi:anti-sigma factor RsiW
VAPDAWRLAPVVMKSCRRNTVALLADYLEQRLPPHIHAELERHLASCATCVAQLRTYQSTVSLLRSLTDEDLPPELRYSLHAFIKTHCN